ncbi:PD40 domain-containing protein, partial [Candidatus Dependentiae bacterium]|nr:PD40 domain-containing protein [Candidatus Dependentiae bacterium]
MVRKKQRVTAEDLYKYEVLNGCQISPDGKHIIFSLQRVDRKTEKKYSNIWIIPTVDGTVRKFTFGDQVDINPKWSPDGRSIAFLSNRRDEKQFQIFIIPLNGGEAEQLTKQTGKFGD